MNTKIRAGVISIGALGVVWSAAATAATPGLTPLFADATLGRAVVEFILAGMAFGGLGLAFKLGAARILERGRASVRATSLATASTQSVVVELPAPTDATASEFDEFRRPEFAPVISLTEAQVSRQRAERERDRRRATLSRA